MAVRGTAILTGTFQVDKTTLKLSEDGSATSSVQLAKTGIDLKKGARKFSITAADLDSMVANSKRSSTELPLDYNHLSLAAKNADQAIAAGWIKSGTVERRGNELWAEAEWTPKAAEHIKNGEYRYVSPVILHNSVDEEGKEIGTELLGAAITNYPFLKGMAPVALSDLTDNGSVELADLSIDERRSRVASAITEKFGGGWEYASMLDCFDDYAIYRKGDKVYRVGYIVDSALNVSLGDESQEVVVQYEALKKDLPGGSKMADENKPIDLTSNPAFVELTRNFEVLKGNLQVLTDENKTLKERADASEKALKLERANHAVDGLVTSAKIKVEDREDWVELHMEAPDRFAKLVKSLKPAVALNTEHGTGEGDAQLDATLGNDENGDRAIAMMGDAVDAYIKDNPGTKYGDAVRAVTNKNPKLADKYREAYARSTAVTH